MNRQFGAFTGIAMMLIVLNHAITFGSNYSGMQGYPSMSGWGSYVFLFLQLLGLFGVPIFYFISGSFVAYAAQGDPPMLSRKFLFSSLRHILVPYLIWSVIFYVLVYYQYGERYSPFQYVKNILVGYPYHFIPLLVFYYVVSPILVKIGYRYAAIMLLVIGIYQLFSMNVVIPGALGFAFPGWMRLLTPPILRDPIADWAIYFPLGVVYGLHAKQMLPWLRRYVWLFLTITVLALIGGALHMYKVIWFPVGGLLGILPFLLALPAITRDQVPLVRWFEKLGKRSYGLYLVHIIVIDIALLLVQGIVAGVLGIPALLFALLFFLGLLIPMGIMGLAAKGPTRRVYRYLFG